MTSLFIRSAHLPSAGPGGAPLDDNRMDFPAGERPFSLTALARRTPPGRCTAVPDCSRIATCAATPTMRRACEQAFRDWVRRGVAADPQHRPFVHPRP